VNQDLSPWDRDNPQPLPPSGGTNGTAQACDSCKPPTGINIVCCSQNFSDITSGNNINIDAVQNCSQTVNSQIEAAIKAAAVPPPVASTAMTPASAVTTPTPAPASVQTTRLLEKEYNATPNEIGESKQPEISLFNKPIFWVILFAVMIFIMIIIISLKK
jgi:hypothetical protein